MNKLLRHSLPAIIGICGVAVFFWWAIGNLTDFNFPAEGVVLDFMDRLFASEFRFFSLPHFNWHSDWCLYPYGVDITFVFWAFEQNVLQMMCERLFGSFFPNQWYYVLSLLITYFGVYVLISPRKGRLWGTVFAFALTFCNYASICKFPGHFSHCIVHWITLSILTDAILVEKFWTRERISAAFWQWRILLWFLCLGLEMGYLAGLALAVSLFAGVYILIALVVVERSWHGVFGRLRGLICDFRMTYGRAKAHNAVLTALIALVAWTYLPIVLQIMVHSSVITEKTVIWATHPLRLLIPILPGLNPSTVTDPRLANVDTIYAWNAGWTFLLVAILSILKGGLRALKHTFPFLLLFALLLVFDVFPVLSYLPMFKCCRIPERFSPGVIVFLLVPLYFVVSKFSIDAVKRLMRTKWEVLLLVGSLFAVEFAIAYASTFKWCKLEKFPQDYRQAVEAVRQLPGEGLFFMPFSAHGGDGNGMTKYHYLTAHQMQFAAMCGKKMNGCYLGRMAANHYLADFDNFGWPNYLSGGAWSSNRWEALETFFRNANFCAIALCKTDMTPAQRADIVAHVGSPIKEFDIFGRAYEIIPIPERLRGKGDLKAVRSLHWTLDELSEEEVPVSNTGIVRLLEGFGPFESWGVWAMKQKCRFAVSMPRSDKQLHVIARVSPFQKMRKAIARWNGRVVGEWPSKRPGVSNQEFWIDLPASCAGKEIVLEIEQHNPARPCDIDPNNGDTRSLGLGFVSLRLAKGD